MKLTNMFPTELWEDYDDSIDNELLTELLLADEKKLPIDPEDQEGWMGKANLAHREEFRSVTDLVVRSMEHITHNLGYRSRHNNQMSIDSMWGNVNRYRDITRPHLHSDSDWSFCYYVKVPVSSGSMVIEDPRLHRYMVLKDPRVDTSSNSSTDELVIVPALEGKILLFPSYLMHYVQPNRSKDPRISISGNVRLGRVEVE